MFDTVKHGPARTAMSHPFASRAAVGASLNSPQAFGPYELTERINVGGMAEVFRARDPAHERLVAIKRILPSVAEDEEFIQMFRDEAAIASQHTA